jgi:homoserine O-acetyltransferase/O-succinyltransferase
MISKNPYCRMVIGVLLLTMDFGRSNMSSIASSFISSSKISQPKLIRSLLFFNSDSGMLIPNIKMNSRPIRQRSNVAKAFLTTPQPVRPQIHDQELTWTLTKDFVFESGQHLAGCEVKARLVGPKNAPVILTLGGISANRHACPKSEDGIEGWWPEIVGENRTINTAQYRVLSFDFLPGNVSHETAQQKTQLNLDGGTEHLDSQVDKDAPSFLITTADQARIAHFICKQLNIQSFYAVVGASYGGMVSLSFAQQFPSMVERLVVLCAAHRPHPMGSAWRSIQRKLVRFGLETGQPDKALSLARELGMTTYRTSQEFGERFVSCPGQSSPVEAYLESRGQAFLGTMSPQRYLSLSQSVDNHYVDPSALNVNLTLIGCRQDQLVPVEELRLLADSSKGTAQVVEFDSIFGHDAFLKETAIVAKALKNALNACC